MNKVAVKFRRKADGHIFEVAEDSNNIPMGVAKARNTLFHWCRDHGENAADYKFSAARMIRERSPSVAEIDRRIMSGKRVSASEMNRWVRSPKGHDECFNDDWREVRR